MHGERQRRYRRSSGRSKNSVTQETTTPVFDSLTPSFKQVPVVIATPRMLVTGPGIRHEIHHRCAFCRTLIDLLPTRPEVRSLRKLEIRKRRPP